MKTKIKKPKYCKDEIKPPYKLCWTYALYIKDFETEHCKQCNYYNQANRFDLRVSRIFGEEVI